MCSIINSGMCNCHHSYVHVYTGLIVLSTVCIGNILKVGIFKAYYGNFEYKNFTVILVFSDCFFLKISCSRVFMLLVQDEIVAVKSFLVFNCFQCCCSVSREI